MKRILSVLIIVCMVFIISPVAFADEDNQDVTSSGAIDGNEETSDDESGTTDEDSETEDAGITPDSPLYVLDRLFESIQLTLTFNDEGKAELMVSIANERLAEAGIMKEENKLELLEKVIESYIEVVGQANEKIEKAVNDGKDVKDVIDQIQIVANSGENFSIKIKEVIPEEKIEELESRIQEELVKTTAFMAISQVNGNVKQAREEWKEKKKGLKGIPKDSEDYLKAQEELEAAKQNLEQLMAVKEDIMSSKDELMELYGKPEENGKDNEKTGDVWAEKRQEQLQKKNEKQIEIIEKIYEKRLSVSEKVYEKNENAASKIQLNLQKQLEKKLENKQKQEQKFEGNIQRKINQTHNGNNQDVEDEDIEDEDVEDEDTEDEDTEDDDEDEQSSNRNSMGKQGKGKNKNK